jgi:CHASE3 domain sensor protein
MLDQRIKEARAHIADREVAQQALSVEEREMNAESAEYRRQIESLQQRRADVIKIQKRITQVKQGLCMHIQPFLDLELKHL